MFNVFQSSSTRTSRGTSNKRYACMRVYETLLGIKLAGKHKSLCAAMFAELLGEDWQNVAHKHPSINAFASMKLTLEKGGNPPPFWDFACKFVVQWMVNQADTFEKNEPVKILNPDTAQWGGDGNRELLSFEWRMLEPSHPLYKTEQASAMAFKEKVEEAGGVEAFASKIQYAPQN